MYTKILIQCQNAQKKKNNSEKVFAVSLSTISTLWTKPQREGRQTDRQTALETPAFRYICHQCFHQQASFLQRNSQPQLCSEGRTRSRRSSSKSVTGVLCSYLCNCHRGFSSESCVRFVSCVEVTHSTLEPMVVPMPSVYMQPDYDSFGRCSFLH